MMLSPRLLIAAASSLVGLSDDGAAGVSATFADRIRRRVGLTNGREWDAALIHHWGFWSHFDHSQGASTWPLAPAESPELLGSFAERHGLLRTAPRAGDVFLQFSPRRGEFVRAGVVACVYSDRPADADYWDIVAIEGNSGARGELGGRETQRIVRRMTPSKGDRFIRWTAKP